MNTLITPQVFPFLSFKPPTNIFPPNPPLISLHFHPIYQINPTYLSGHPKKILGIAHCSLSSGYPGPDDDSETELGRLLALLPEGMRDRIEEHPEVGEVVEVVLDLGRRPLARFPSGDFELSDNPITFKDIEYATAQVGDFGIDNRAGISRTLHRISAIRNRKGIIVGLTCRVGRAISGSADLLRDLIEDGASLLLIGPPGVGKTTIIREIARILADNFKKRVMIVDTSNEIGGDGDIPHAGIGNARRMQVPHLDMQHKVLIEAVENHMPQAIVIDEIGTKLEATAASTISQRGIQLVATAHGRTIENLIKNPALDMLVGGIQSVTLGDEEASRRRVQKTILERKGPPAFRCAVEIMSKSELRVHKSLQLTVDAILAGRCPEFSVRKMDFQAVGGPKEESPTSPDSSGKNFEVADRSSSSATVEQSDRQSLLESPTADESCIDDEKAPPLRVFVYGILEATIAQGIHKLNLEDAIEMTDNISEADVFLALQSKLKKNLGIQTVAKSRDKPIYVTKTSSLVQVTKALRSLMTDHEDTNIFELDDRYKPPEEVDALEEARIAIEKIVIRKGKPVDLLPRPPQIVSLQVELAESYQLLSEIVGLDSEAHLRILPIYSDPSSKENDTEDIDTSTALEEYFHTNGNGDTSSHYIEKLPILPD